MKLPLFVSCLLLVSSSGFAQEQVIEVGKHANVNLDAYGMILSLLMVLMLIVISAWVLKKFQLSNKSLNGMKVIASLSLGTKERLVVVEVSGEQLLLAVSQHNISLIKTLDKPLAVSEIMAPDFSQALTKLFKTGQK